LRTLLGTLPLPLDLLAGEPLAFGLLVCDSLAIEPLAFLLLGLEACLPMPMGHWMAECTEKYDHIA